MITINVVGTDPSKYSLFFDNYVLGRRYDNIADAIKVITPEEESQSECYIIFAQRNRMIDIIRVTDEPISIKNNVSQFEWVDVGIRFIKADGYIKNSEIKRCTFLPAIKPSVFVPVKPEYDEKIEQLILKGFCDFTIHNRDISFTNVNGIVVKTQHLDLGTDVKENNIKQNEVNMSENADSNTIAKRNAHGQLIANKPTANKHVATKEYVDGKISDLAKPLTIVDELPNIEDADENIFYKIRDTDKIYVAKKYSSGLTHSGNTITGMGTCTDTDLVIPKKIGNDIITTIGANAFENVTTLNEIYISDGITTIKENAFKMPVDFSNEMNIHISNTVTDIESGNNYFSNVFYQGTLSEYIRFNHATRLINENVTGNLYIQNTKVENTLTIPDDITVITEKCFSGIDAINKVVVGSNVTEIKDNAFADCKNVSEVYISKSVKKIGVNNFNYVAKIYVEDVNSYLSIDTDFTPIDNWVLYTYSGEKITKVRIPETTHTLHNVLRKCNSITSVIINYDIHELADYCFENCNCLSVCNFTMCIYPVTFGTHIFDNIYENIKIYVIVKDYQEFLQNPNLQPYSDSIMQVRIRLPAGSKYYRGIDLNVHSKVGDYEGATEITDAFPDTIENNDIFVYDGYEYRYKCTLDDAGSYCYWATGDIEGWSVATIDKSRVTYPKLYTEICNAPVNRLRYTFTRCTNLINSPYLYDTITDLDFAFHDCSSLKRVDHIPKQCDSMMFAFQHCSDLIYVDDIPDSVLWMTNAFYYCESLVRAPKISNSVKNLRDCFVGCKSLRYASNISSVAENIYGMFNKCSSLEIAPDIPDTVTNMGYAFNKCTSLLHAPNHISQNIQICENAFNECISLKTGCDIPASATNIYAMFEDCINLTGRIRIDTSVTSSSIFSGTKKPITLYGDSTKLQEYAQSSRAGNITVES